MESTVSSRIERAAAAGADELTLFLQDPAPQVIRALLENPHLTEEHALVLASRKNLPPDLLEAIFHNKRWAELYSIKLALAKNPKTPLFTALSIARFLRLFDLADLVRSHQLPIIYRKKLEAIVIEKIPTLPLGVKKTLARLAAGNVLMELMQDGYPEVVRACLDSPHLVEASLYKVISKKTSTAATIRTIAENRTWSCRYQIKFALIRNEHTPLSRTVVFLSELKLYDLRELFRDPLLPPSVRPAVHRELIERGQDPDPLHSPDEPHVFEIDEDDNFATDVCPTGDDE